MALSVYVISSNELLQDVIAHLIKDEECLSYAGASRTANEALDRISALKPDVVVTDAPPANMHDVFVWREIREYGPRVLMLAYYLRADDAALSVLAGANCLVLAPAGQSRALLDLILRIGNGESPRAEGVARRLNEAAIGYDGNLSEEQRRVLRLVIDGMSDVEIASKEAATMGEVRGWVADIAEKVSQRLTQTLPEVRTHIESTAASHSSSRKQSPA